MIFLLFLFIFLLACSGKICNIYVSFNSHFILVDRVTRIYSTRYFTLIPKDRIHTFDDFHFHLYVNFEVSTGLKFSFAFVEEKSINGLQSCMKLTWFCC